MNVFKLFLVTIPQTTVTFLTKLSPRTIYSSIFNKFQYTNEFGGVKLKFLMGGYYF